MPTAPEEMTLKVIAHIHTAFPTKFGIPRQSGLVDELRGEVIFTPNTATPTPCAGWKISATSGWCGSSPARCGTAGPHRPPAASRRQHPDGRVRHPVPLPAQPSGPFQRQAGRPSSTARTWAPSSSCAVPT